MQLNIKPIHIDGLDCFTATIIPVANYHKLDYELTFMDALGFEYNREEFISKGVFENSIYVNGFHILENLSNISFTVIEKKTADEIIQIIEQQISKNLGTPIYIDTYWCPWHGDYQELHHIHYCLAIGIEDEKIICVDSAISSNIYYLPFSDYNNGFKECALIHINNNIKKIDPIAVLKESIEKIDCLKILKNIRDFALDFKTNFNAIEEFKNIKISWWDVILLRNLHFISGSRSLYSKFIDNISNKLQSRYLHNIYLELCISSDKWNSLQLSLLNCAYSGEFNEITKIEIYNEINQIADLEEEVFKELNDIITDPKLLYSLQN